MERIQRGFRLVGASWKVLKADRELMVLPAVSFVAVLAVGGSLFGVAWGTGYRGDEQPTILQYTLLAVFYFLSYFIGVFSNAAIVGAATIRLNGGDPTLKDGLRMAWSKVDKIIAWAALGATVGLILRMLEERAGLLGRIVIRIVGAAWGAITFFVVPVLLYEPLGVTDSVKRSATIFKARWGEQFVGNASIGIAMFLLMVPVVLVGMLIVSVAPLIGVPLMVVVVMLLATAGTAMSAIFNAALYRFATTGEATGGFSAEDLGGTFIPRRGRVGGGPAGFSGPMQ